MEIDSPNATGIISGFGMPTGGTSGQLLQKVNATNYNTQWVDSDTPVYLSANKSTSQAIANNIESTLTNWDVSLVNNTPSAWNGTTGVWTCPRAGIYDISLAVMTDAVAAGALNLEFAPIISHTPFGGSAVIYVSDYWSTSTASLRIPTTIVRVVLNCGVGDTIRPRVYNNWSAGGVVISSGRNYFIIKQLPGKIIR